MIRLQNLLVPTDFSASSENALRYAVAFADQFGSALHMLHVIGHPAEFGFHGVPIAELHAEAEAKALKKMNEHKGLWSDYNFPVHCEVRVGTPFVEIVRYAKAQNTDLVILGTHGRGKIAHTLLGSVAERVVRKAPCPVLTVRDDEHEFVMP